MPTQLPGSCPLGRAVVAIRASFFATLFHNAALVGQGAELHVDGTTRRAEKRAKDSAQKLERNLCTKTASKAE